MPRKQLTPALLQHLKPPARGVIELWDMQARGLSLRVFASGRATWTYRYRPKDGGSRRRVKLGEFPGIGLAEARRRADRLRGAVSDGKDPQAALEARREAPTLSALIDRYLAEDVKPKKKPATHDLYSHFLLKLVAPRLGFKRAHEITPGDVDRLHRKLGATKRVTANRAVVALSGVYTFAARRRLIAAGVNPARGIEKFQEQSRERYLSTEELGRLGQVLRLGELEGLAWPREAAKRGSKHDRKPENQKTILSRHVTAALRLLLFTGCRLREFLQLRWSEVDFERGLLLLPDSKTGRKTVVLNAPALQVLTDSAEDPRLRVCGAGRRSEKAARRPAEALGPGEASREAGRRSASRSSTHSREHRRRRRPWPADHRQTARSQARRHHRALRPHRCGPAAPRVEPYRG